jgi:hypothetical protein
MGVTGWLGEDPEPTAPAPAVGGFSQFILANRAPDTGRTLEQVLARAKRQDKPPEPYDDDDRQAGLLTRGYQPGMLRSLSEQLGDTVAELEAEREKVEKGKRRQEIAAREHASGRADVWQMQRMLDGDFGDQATVERLERRADGLRRQIAETQNMISPPQRRDLDPLEAASRAAHEMFREVTRARWAEAQSGIARPQAPRPFGSVSRGRSTEHVADGPCWVCEEGRRRDAARDRADFAAVYGEIGGAA